MANAIEKTIADIMVFRFEPNNEVAARKAEFYRKLMADDDIEVFDPDDFGSARRLLAKIIKDNVEKRGVEKVRIGVSSGLDSRAVLGAALDVLPSEAIYAETYGHEGNRDYENAYNLVGSRLNHYMLLNRVSMTVRVGGIRGLSSIYETEKIIARGDEPPKGLVQIGGRLGDAITGSALTEDGLVADWNTAKRILYYSLNKTQTRVMDRLAESGMLPEGYDPAHALSPMPLIDKEIMSYEDQVNLLYRQHQYICLVAGGIDDINLQLSPKFDSVKDANKHHFHPFIDSRWQKSFLRLPHDMRVNKKFYKEFLKSEYPALYPDLVDPHYLMKADSGPTAVSWKQMWKKDKRMAEGVAELLYTLNAKGGWFNIDDLMGEAQKGDNITIKIIQRLCEAAGRLSVDDKPASKSGKQQAAPAPDLRSVSRVGAISNGNVDKSRAVFDQFEAVARTLPSDGGHKLARFFRKLARNAPPGTNILELGAWMGAGTAQLALGLLERADPKSAKLRVYDQFQASVSEVAKLRRQGVDDIDENVDTLPWIRRRFEPVESAIDIEYLKGSIFDASWSADEPISIYVDDLSKGNFIKITKIFGPGWRAGVTKLVLMDYFMFNKKEDSKYRIQHEFISSHPDSFKPIDEKVPGGTSTAAFIYTGGLNFSKL